MMTALPRVMLVSNPRSTPGFARMIDEAVRGGLELFQLRDDGASRFEKETTLRTLRMSYPSLRLLLNSEPELAVALGVGLHEKEQSVFRTPSLRPPLVGRSVHSADSAKRAEDDGVDYLVLGTIFPTRSKPVTRPAGLDLVHSVSDEVAVPVYAIGGIRVRSARAVREAGAHGLAVNRAITGAEKPCEATQALRSAY